MTTLMKLTNHGTTADKMRTSDYLLVQTGSFTYRGDTPAFHFGYSTIICAIITIMGIGFIIGGSLAGADPGAQPGSTSTMIPPGIALTAIGAVATTILGACYCKYRE